MREATIQAWRPREDDGDDEVVDRRLDALLGALSREKVISARPPWRLVAADGTRIVIFEWISPQGARRAQDNPAINERLSELELVAEQIPLGDLEEAEELDASFGQRA